MKITEKLKILQDKHLEKNTCASCQKSFDNSPALYNLRGNYCSDCSAKIENKVKWRTARKHNDEAKMRKLGEMIWKRWH